MNALDLHLDTSLPKKNPISSLGIKLFDIVIIVLLLIICGIWIVSGSFSKEENLTAVVYVDGEEVYSKEINTQSESKTFNGVTVEFDEQSVKVSSSDCPNQLCVRTGTIYYSGEAIACVPNKVVVILKSEKATADIVAY